MESEYAAAFSDLCDERIPDAHSESNAVCVNAGGIADPHFVVFYNGEEEREAESVLKLSHSFCQKEDEPELELIVKVLNINLDKKQRILETCCLLKEYMLLVDKIRKYAAEYKDINRAAEQAVTECIEENILADFLRKNRTEAIEVCIFEYDEKPGKRN